MAVAKTRTVLVREEERVDGRVGGLAEPAF
jgi:hypothetical protein